MSIASGALAAAMRAYHAGQWVEAELHCQQVLADEPQAVTALHLLGAIAQQTGRLETAIARYRETLALDPQYAEAHSNLGVALQTQGDLAAAATHLQQALALEPENATTHFNLGNVHLAQKDWAAAIAQYRAALALQPHYLKALNNLATALREQGDWTGAMRVYEQAIAAQPQNPEFYVNLGNLLQETGDPTLAIAQYQQALLRDPQNALACFNLGTLFLAENQIEAAINHLRQVVAQHPEWAEAHTNLGLALQAQHQRQHAATDYRPGPPATPPNLTILDTAIDHLRQAIARRPDWAQAHQNLAVALYERRDLEGAIAALEQAITLEPENAAAHLNLSLALLAQGDLPRGFAAYEWRWQFPEFQLPELPGQPWPGDPLQPDQTLLLRAEQGSGDTLQFIRYAALIPRNQGQVTLQCPPELTRLLQNAPGLDAVVSTTEVAPKADWHLPLLSLPRVLGTTQTTIPAPVPYLAARVEAAPLPTGRPNVGLVWATAPTGNLTSQSRQTRANRSASLTVFMGLQAVPGVHWYSLQVGEPAAEIVSLGFQADLHDLRPHIQDFADTAALIAQLDLVITIDTAVAHLAGALGQPVWVVLPFSADWRWGLEGDTTPWYPTMRLFRQARPGDWASAIAQVRDALPGFLRQLATTA